MPSPLVNRHIGGPSQQKPAAFDTAKLKDPSEGKRKLGFEFHDMLRSSNSEAKKTTHKLNEGDLSSYTNDNELFEAMARKNNLQRTPKSKLGKDDFLKLFVTQLQNQDPLKPKDHSDMAAQLAQFNGLEQMLNVNKNLESMKGMQEQSSNFSLMQSIGKVIEVSDGKFQLNAGESPALDYRLEFPAENAFIKVKDASGEVIAEQPHPRLEAGVHTFSWDGMTKQGKMAPSGAYTFEVEARGLNGKNEVLPMTRKLKVTGINLESQSRALKTASGDYALSDINALGVEAEPVAQKPTLTAPHNRINHTQDLDRVPPKDLG